MDLRNKILSSKDLKSELVHVPEWDVEVLVQSMTAGERGEVLEAVRDLSGAIRLGKMQTLVALKCARDPETKARIFEDGDLDVLAGKLAAAVDRIATAGMRLSGMTEETQAAMEKNSETASGSITSDSPANSE